MKTRNRPDLIVPVRDRRQRKRYLTWRNVRNVTLVAMLVFAVITIRSEMYDKGPANYGRIYERALPEPVPRVPLPVVAEKAAPVDDQTQSDPMLVEPMARSQWLGMNEAAMTADVIDSPGNLPVTIDTSARAVESVQSGGTRVAIVGGTEGVAIVKHQRTKPILSGGFGR